MSLQSYPSRLSLHMLLLLFAAVAIANPPEESLQSQTDAFTYPTRKHIAADFTYSQMWYFNFLDEKNDIAAVFGAGINNPENKYSIPGLTTSIGMVVRDAAQGESFVTWGPRFNPAEPGKFSASSSFEPGPGLQMHNPSLSIKVLSADAYQVSGTIRDDYTSVKVNLRYTRAPGGLGKAWIPWEDRTLPRTFKLLPAWITYHMHMPNAVVNGEVEFQSDVRKPASKKKYHVVNAKGYHDGFFGELVFSIFEWDWLDYKQDNMSIQLLRNHADRVSCSKTKFCVPDKLRVLYDNGRGVKEFELNQMTVHYDRLKKDLEEKGISYPTQETINATDALGNKLKLIWKLKRSIKVHYKMPFPFKDTYTYENVADFQGSFFDAASGISVPISGLGWSDCSGLKAQ